MGTVELHNNPAGGVKPSILLLRIAGDLFPAGWDIQDSDSVENCTDKKTLPSPAPDPFVVAHANEAAPGDPRLDNHESKLLPQPHRDGLHLVPKSPNLDSATPAKRTRKSMSRRTGQSGHVEESGKWWVVRWWMDVLDQDKRTHKRARICPILGPGSLSKSARERRAREIIAESGADTEGYFNTVVKQATGITFEEQAKTWVKQVTSRKRKPVANSTLESWEGCLRTWLIPQMGDVPLAAVNNSTLKTVVAAMVKGKLSPKTIDNYVQVVKTVVASAMDKEGEELYPRKWNHEFIDMPIVVKANQNTPSFSTEVMSGLAAWKYERERLLFILCGAAGLRIGEALGLEIDKHISPDFLTLSIEQKARHGRVEKRLKTMSAFRKIDLHPIIAASLKEFAGKRKGGFLFCTRTGKPLGTSNILRRHLHPALKKLGYVNVCTGTGKAGSHAFRRFRNTHLRNRTECPEGLQKFWLGHADESMGDLYDKIKEDAEFRKEWAQKCGFGFKLPSLVPNVPKIEEVSVTWVAA